MIDPNIEQRRVFEKWLLNSAGDANIEIKNLVYLAPTTCSLWFAFISGYTLKGLEENAKNI